MAVWWAYVDPEEVIVATGIDFDVFWTTQHASFRYHGDIFNLHVFLVEGFIRDESGYPLQLPRSLEDQLPFATDGGCTEQVAESDILCCDANEVRISLYLNGAKKAHLPRISSRSSVVSNTTSTAVLIGVDEVVGALTAQVASISNDFDRVWPCTMYRCSRGLFDALA
jgi:hypothetical protein